MKAKNPVMVNAGKKAAATRKANKEAQQKKWSEAGKKAAAKRRENKLAFHNESGAEKIKRRELKAKAYKDSGIHSGSLLFMPSQTCEDINVINRVIPRNEFHYIGSEINEQAQKEIRRKKQENGYKMSLMPFSIADIVMNAGENDYSHVDLDFCETFSRYYATLGTAIVNKIVQKNGIITATFAARDLNISTTAQKILGAKRVKELKANGENLILPTLTKFIKTLGKYSYRFICEPETYTDSKQGNHMVFFIIQRVK